MQSDDLSEYAPLKIMLLSNWYSSYEPDSGKGLHRLLWLDDGKGMLYLAAGSKSRVPQYQQQGWILLFDELYLSTFLLHYPKYTQYQFFSLGYEQLYVPLDADQTAELGRIALGMQRAIAAGQPVEFLQGVLDLGLIIAAGAYARVSQVTADSWETRKMAQLRELMEVYFITRLGSDFYAARLKIDVRKLNELCRHFTGRNVVEELNHLRMVVAQRELIMGNKRIKEIALDLGFDNLSHFSTFFSSRNGISPRGFRKLSHGESV